MPMRTFICLAVIACFAVMSSPSFSADTPLPVRAPDAVKGTTPEMLDPAFWIARIRDPDRVIMTPGDIAELNKVNADRDIPDDHPYARNIAQIEKDGPSFKRMNPLGLGGAFPGETVRARLVVNNERLRKGTFYDYWELPLTDAKKDEYIEAVAIDTVPESIVPRTAIIVHHTSARLYPTKEPAYRMRGYLDDNNVTSLDIGMPAAVLHRSKNGDFAFVMTPIAWGWVPAEDIAFAEPRVIRNYVEADEFVVCTTHRVPLYADILHETSAGYLYMGERANLVKKDGGRYVVSIPVRTYDGKVEFRWAWLDAGEGTSEGWLPYTQRNVITTAFRLLGRPYGWHDSWNERDCGGIMRVIFNCFGFTLPRYWSFEQLCTDRATYVGESKDVAEKNALLATMPEGITFTGTTGHITLYLGTVDGTPYSIHQCGWNYKDGDTEYKMARVVVSDYINVGFDMKNIQFFAPMEK